MLEMFMGLYVVFLAMWIGGKIAKKEMLKDIGKALFIIANLSLPLIGPKLDLKPDASKGQQHGIRVLGDNGYYDADGTFHEDETEASEIIDLNDQYFSEFDVNEAEVFPRPNYGPNGPSTWGEMCWDAHWARGVHVDEYTGDEFPMQDNYCQYCNSFFID